MTNFIAIVPLKVVVFPGEILNIHFEEKKYIQLINDCITDKKSFGVIWDAIQEVEIMGTLMEVIEISQTHENGNIDVRLKGVDVFRILHAMPSIEEKLYSGAVVNYPENKNLKIAPSISELIINEVKSLYQLLSLENKFPEEKTEWVSYDIAHTLGFSEQQEYELLTILNETQRMEYIRRHLKSMLSVVKELEILKARIMLNGHFRTLT